MEPALARVIAWRDRLRAIEAPPGAPPLSPEGARLGWTWALDALTDDALAHAVAMPGEPWARAAMVVARTVVTAPIEWAAVLLGRGTALALKTPRGSPGAAPALVEAAAAVGLPLSWSDDRGALRDAELVVAMGSDASVAAIRASHANTLGFGGRFSVAWVTELSSVEALAWDAAAHDGRGCMSPAAIFTPLDPDVVAQRLADAMAGVEREVPRGALSAAEAAELRTRRALGRAAGRVWEGPGWAVHRLPVERWSPVARPRALDVHGVRDVSGLTGALGPLVERLSTVATDDPALSVPARLCAPGEMQRPPLARLHDGVDWLRATNRPPNGARLAL